MWSRKQEGDLWKHEWMKHGTCALSYPPLNSELKYFKQGLDWSKQYQLSKLLDQGDIKPNGTYPINQFWHTLKTGLGKNPRIDCYIDEVCYIFLLFRFKNIMYFTKQNIFNTRYK